MQNLIVQATQEILYLEGTFITSARLWVLIDCKKVVRGNIKHDSRNEGKHLSLFK